MHCTALNKDYELSIIILKVTFHSVLSDKKDKVNSLFKSCFMISPIIFLQAIKCKYHRVHCARLNFTCKMNQHSKALFLNRGFNKCSCNIAEYYHKKQTNKKTQNR